MMKRKFVFFNLFCFVFGLTKAQQDEPHVVSTSINELNSKQGATQKLFRTLMSSLNSRKNEQESGKIGSLQMSQPSKTQKSNEKDDAWLEQNIQNTLIQIESLEQMIEKRLKPLFGKIALDKHELESAKNNNEGSKVNQINTQNEQKRQRRDLINQPVPVNPFPSESNLNSQFQNNPVPLMGTNDQNSQFQNPAQNQQMNTNTNNLAVPNMNNQISPSNNLSNTQNVQNNPPQTNQLNSNPSNLNINQPIGAQPGANSTNQIMSSNSQNNTSQNNLQNLNNQNNQNGLSTQNSSTNVNSSQQLPKVLLQPNDQEAKELSTAPKGLLLVVKEPGQSNLAVGQIVDGNLNPVNRSNTVVPNKFEGFQDKRGKSGQEVFNKNQRQGHSG